MSRGVVPTRQAWNRVRAVVHRVEREPDAAGAGLRRGGRQSVADIAVEVIGARGIPQYGLFWKDHYRQATRDYAVRVPNAAGLRSIGIATEHIGAGGRGQGFDSGDRLVIWYNRTDDYTPKMRAGFFMGPVKDEPFASYDPFGPLRCLQIVSYPQTGSPGLALVRFEGGA